MDQRASILQGTLDLMVLNDDVRHARQALTILRRAGHARRGVAWGARSDLGPGPADDRWTGNDLADREPAYSRSESRRSLLQTVVPGYFEVLGLPVEQGRVFEPRDNVAGAAPVAIVNERFARKFWPTYLSQATPVGDRLHVPILPAGRLEIAGVVADVRHAGPAREADPQVYIPDRLYPPQVAFLALRADGDPVRVVAAVREQVRAIDPNQSVADVMTLEDMLERSTGQQHVAARLRGLFAAGAVVLALVGLYGVMA